MRAQKTQKSIVTWYFFYISSKALSGLAHTCAYVLFLLLDLFIAALFSLFRDFSGTRSWFSYSVTGYLKINPIYDRNSSICEQPVKWPRSIHTLDAISLCRGISLYRTFGSETFFLIPTYERSTFSQLFHYVFVKK